MTNKLKPTDKEKEKFLRDSLLYGIGFMWDGKNIPIRKAYKRMSFLEYVKYKWIRLKLKIKAWNKREGE